MKKWSQILATTTIMAVAVGTIAGCGSTQSNSSTASNTDDNATPVDGGSVTLQLPSTPDTDFNPIVGNNLYTLYAANQFVFDQLFQEQPDGTFSGKLAKSYDISSDKKTITLHLNPAAKWSDGQPVTSDDVAFTLNVIATKEYQDVLQGPDDVSKIQGFDALHDKNSFADVAAGKLSMSGIKIIDPQTLSVTLVDALANPITQINNYIIPKHVWASIPADQWKVKEQDVKTLVSSGPFMLTDYKSQEYYTLEKNDNYYGGKPHLDKITWKVVPSDTASGMLKNGQLDMAMWVKPADMKLYDTLTNVKKISVPSWSYQYLGFKTNNRYLQDKALRQAIAYSIDRDSIIKALFLGQAQKAELTVPHGYYYPKDGEIKTYNYDPAKAKQVLKDAGYQQGSDGKWLGKDGQPMKLTLSYPKGNKTREQAAPMYVDFMNKIGLDVTLSPPTDFATLDNKVLKDDPSIQMWLMGGTFNRLDPDQTGSWGAKDPWNFSRWNNKENEQLTAESVSAKASDKSVRRDIMIKWENLYKEELPELDLYQENDIYYFNTRLHGVKDYHNVYDIYYNPQDWWVSKK